MNTTIDLDANATTRLDPDVLADMARALAEYPGNASSNNSMGAEARNLTEQARKDVANLIGAHADEIIFVPSATAAINLAIRGFVLALPEKSTARILSSPVEHAAVMRTVGSLHYEGLARVTPLRVSSDGLVDVTYASELLKRKSAIMCLLHGNNEIGTINPLSDIVSQAKAQGVAVFIDASQTGGYSPPRVDELAIDMMCLSSHKMHGPFGAAALYLRRGIKIKPIMFGGEQENGLWPGTLNVPAIVGFGSASRMASREFTERSTLVTRLRDLLLDKLCARIPDLRLNGHRTNRLPSNLNVTIPFLPADILQRRLTGIAFSTGSACAGGEASHVLRAIGLSTDEIHWTIRLGVSKFNTANEIESAGIQIGAAARVLRGEGRA